MAAIASAVQDTRFSRVMRAGIVIASRAVLCIVMEGRAYSITLRVVAYSPLASGLLGGRYTTERTFDPGGWRSHDPRFTGEGLRRTIAIVDRLKEIAARYDKTSDIEDHLGIGGIGSYR